MSKKITHERMKAIIDFNSEYYEEMIDYITQQEKQEKLFELYKKVASTIVRTSIEQPIYVIRISEREMVEQSFNRIKELENE